MPIITSELVAASPAEAAGVLESQRPTDSWEGFSFQGLDNVKLITLWSLLERGAADDRIEERLRALTHLSKGEQGPWVDIVPAPMLDTLAEVPSLEEEAFEALSGRWQATPEFAGWESEDVSFLLQQAGELAQSARLQEKTLILRQSH